MNTRADRPDGFTRTDLVASVGAVTVLAVLAPTLFGGGQRQGEAAACLENFRRLTQGWMMYASDYQGFLPPNVDNGSTVPGKAWVPGIAGAGAGQEFDTGILANPNLSLIYNYSGKDVTVFRCPSDLRRGVYRPSGAPPVPDSPAARSVSANAAVGTDPEKGGGKVATDGPWLDNMHSHKANLPWRTYGKLDDMVAPGPSGLFLLIDEDACSLNDAVFAMGMNQAEWLDWPGTRHDGGATVSFADGHVEMHRWTDQRTWVIGANVARRTVAGSEDHAWLSQRTSARAR